jgi:hypothetical protein
VAAMLALANVAPLRVNCERESTREVLITAVLDGIFAVPRVSGSRRQKERRLVRI